MFKRLRAHLRVQFDAILEWVVYKLISNPSISSDRVTLLAIKQNPKAYARWQASEIDRRQAIIQKFFTLDKQFISKTEEPKQRYSSGGSWVKGRDFVGKDFRPKHIQDAEAAANARREQEKTRQRISELSKLFTSNIHEELVKNSSIDSREGDEHYCAMCKALGCSEHKNLRRLRPRHVPQPDPTLPPDQWLAEAERLKTRLRTTPMDNQAMAALAAEDETPRSATELLGRVPVRRPESTDHVKPKPTVIRRKPFIPNQAQTQADESFVKRDGDELLKAGEFRISNEDVTKFIPMDEPQNEETDGVTMFGEGPTHESIQRQINEAIETFVRELEAKGKATEATTSST